MTEVGIAFGMVGMTFLFAAAFLALGGAIVRIIELRAHRGPGPHPYQRRFNDAFRFPR